MKFFKEVLSKEEIKEIRKSFGDYVKVTADIQNKSLVVGCKLHADGERILLEEGGKQDNIWGGGINLRDKIIDTTAVLNLRSRIGNDSMEILDRGNRKKFINLTKKFFKILWR